MHHRLLFCLSAIAVLGAGGALAGDGLPGSKASTTAGNRLLNDLARARGGESLSLAPGDYGAFKIVNREFKPAVRIVANGARFTSIVLTNVAGLAIEGGTVTGAGERSIGIDVKNGQDLSFQRMTITGAHRGIAIGRSNGVLLNDLTLTGLGSDGVDLALSRRITLRGIRCSNFSPTHSVYDASGKLIKVGDHPDCIQAWSRPAMPPVADILVEDSQIEGDMQGIFFGNHVRDGVDDGGFDRIRIRNNTIRVNRYNAIVIIDGRNSEIVNNRVSTLPGGVNTRRPNAVIRAGIRVKGGKDNMFCANKVSDFPSGPGTMACKRN